MCGIYAAVNGTCVADSLVNGLQALAYRGYDSAGIAMPGTAGLQRRRSPGKLGNLVRILTDDPLSAPIGIAHTRWATHGVPSATNAHPHMTPRVAVVHNGIVENHAALRARLETDGYAFDSDTDTEVIPALIDEQLRRGRSPRHALQCAMHSIKGSLALAVLFDDEPDRIYATRYQSPLHLGSSGKGHYLSSDSQAFGADVRCVCTLGDGEIAMLQNQHVAIWNAYGKPVEPGWTLRSTTPEQSDKDGHDHYMMKEIVEQPAVIHRTLACYQDDETGMLRLPTLPFDVSQVSRISIIACGSSYFAGMIGRYWLEKFAGLPVDLDIASESRHRGLQPDPRQPVLAISQSGETADTLAALRHAREIGQPVVSIVNVPGSTMATESDQVLLTRAGPEIGVASTKAFIAQLTVLAAFTIETARTRGRFSAIESSMLVAELNHIAGEIDEMLRQATDLDAIAALLASHDHALFLGRGVAYPVAEEGALKLKEVSYIHAEAYPAGELKHGPIALVDTDLPVVVVAPPDELFAKTLSNLREVAARGGRVILLSDAEGIEQARPFIEHGLELPPASTMLAPLLYTLPLQLLAYRVGLCLGTDIDQPRNLAKSVTVE